jgi:hypothetical protein
MQVPYQVSSTKKSHKMPSGANLSHAQERDGNARRPYHRQSGTNLRPSNNDLMKGTVSTTFTRSINTLSSTVSNLVSTTPSMERSPDEAVYD